MDNADDIRVSQLLQFYVESDSLILVRSDTVYECEILLLDWCWN